MTAEIKLYKNTEFELNNPKPIPVFQTKSKLTKLFIKYVFSLKYLIISDLEYLSKKKAINIIVRK